MITVYMILVGVLFILAISDLIVGVSNDAVNFLNSAIGSKVASVKWIFAIASLGVIAGATFSNGMMEVARKGIFHPEFFSFTEVMIIFIAVMVTDVILLDLFNTFALPTSTTVSIVFELLGAAVAVSLFKIHEAGESIQLLGKYINSEKALLIILGILLSIVIAFSAGLIVQFFSRIIFSFNYTKPYKYFGSIFGGIAISIITYFMLIKGAKGSSFLTGDIVTWIKFHTMEIFIFSFIGWTILLQILIWLFRVNIFKIIVLIGTFALAMAFAGNDLVNFIGVPLAGLKSFQEFATSGLLPNDFSMGVLASKIKTPTIYLLFAGIIMITTLWFSKKSREVIKTSLNLSRQSEGYERFTPSFFSRVIVRKAIIFGNIMKKIIPNKTYAFIEKRFDNNQTLKNQQKNISFDLVRASVNLVVASILISIATSLKLPLSTTYVTFMVAMGTSLADGAWGRESAVYRITGVMTVIGGWFMTAFVAFTSAFILASIIFLGGFIGTFILIALALMFIIRTQYAYRKKEKTEQESLLGELHISKKCTKNVIFVVKGIKEIYDNTMNALYNEDLSELKKNKIKMSEINSQTKVLKNTITQTIRELKKKHVNTGHYYVQVLDYLREVAHSSSYILYAVYKHINNNHKPLIDEQIKELTSIQKSVNNVLDSVLKIIEDKKFIKINKVIEEREKILNFIDTLSKRQIKRIMNNTSGTSNTILYSTILNETKNTLLQIVNLLKAQRDFIMFQK